MVNHTILARPEGEEYKGKPWPKEYKTNIDAELRNAGVTEKDIVV